MTSNSSRLAAREALISRAGKRFISAALLLWLFMIGYTATPGIADQAETYLLTSHMRFVSAHLGVDPLDITYMWGGPITALSVSFFASAFGISGFALIVWRRLRHGPWSKTGGLMLVLSVLIASQLFGRTMILYPAVLDQNAAERLVSAVNSHKPGLIDNLRLGKRPKMPLIQNVSVTRDGPNPAQTLLGDRRTVEGLRFFVAQKAMKDGDAATVRRMLPFAMPLFEGDLLAQNVFAARIFELERFAGKAAVPHSDRVAMLDGARRWSFLTTLALNLRPIMQLLLLTGIICSALGLHMRRRLRRIDRIETTLQTSPVMPTRGGSIFGRRGQI